MTHNIPTNHSINPNVNLALQACLAQNTLEPTRWKNTSELYTFNNINFDNTSAQQIRLNQDKMATAQQKSTQNTKAPNFYIKNT